MHIVVHLFYFFSIMFTTTKVNRASVPYCKGSTNSNKFLCEELSEGLNLNHSKINGLDKKNQQEGENKHT